MSLIARYAPFNRFSPAPAFFREFDALLGALEPAEAAKVLTPSADVAEREHAFEVHVDLPGLAPEAISVKLEGDTLTVSVSARPRRRRRKAAGCGPSAPSAPSPAPSCCPSR